MNITIPKNFLKIFGMGSQNTSLEFTDNSFDNPRFLDNPLYFGQVKEFSTYRNEGINYIKCRTLRGVGYLRIKSGYLLDEKNALDKRDLLNCVKEIKYLQTIEKPKQEKKDRLRVEWEAARMQALHDNINYQSFMEDTAQAYFNQKKN